MSITEADLMRIYLNRISYNYPDIPKIPDSSAFGEAADTFADIFGLESSDSSAFFTKLNKLHSSVYRAQILASALEQLEDVPAQYPGELRKENAGDHVKLMQTWLYGVSMFFPTVTAPELSGIFDTETENSVKSFQQLFGLPVTGRADRAVWNSLYRTFAGLHQEKLPVPRPFTTELKEGMSGDDVLLLQQYINMIHTDLGYPPVLKETGRFGAVTAKEVEELQGLMRLPPNGKVDRKTWDAISELYIDSVIGGIKRTFQFPGEILAQPEHTQGS